MNIKKDDKVVVLSGKDKGKEGKVLSADPKGGKLIVEGVNVATKHQKPKNQQDQGGIIKTETPIYACKVMVVCPKCGCAVAPTKTVDPNASPKSRLITLLLCIFVGGLGIHRFYVGKIGTGVLWLLTAGCFGIGALVDLIMIACGTFTDSDGKPVTDWQT